MLSILMKNHNSTLTNTETKRVVLISQTEDQSLQKDGYCDPITSEMNRINYQPFYGFSDMMTNALPLNTNSPQLETNPTFIFNYKAWDKKLFNKIVRKTETISAALFSGDIQRSLHHV